APLLVLTRDEPGLDRQLLSREPYSFARCLFVNPFHLKKHAPRLDHSDPSFGRSFAFSHTGFSRLLCNWLVREYADPYLSAALDESSHGDTRSLNLLASNPGRLQRFQPVLAKTYLRAARGHTAHSPALLLTIFHPLWNLVFSHVYTNSL